MKVRTADNPSKRHAYIENTLVIKLKPKVETIPNAFAFSASRRGRVKSSTLEGPLFRLTQAGLLREVIPLFDADGMRRSRRSPAAYDIVPGAFAQSTRDSLDLDLAGLTVIKLRPKSDILAIERELRRDPAVEYVHRAAARWIIPQSKIVREPILTTGLPWNFRAINWKAKNSDASNVIVGIMDTGYDLSHPNLPVPGSYEYGGSSAEDVLGHGTHVAGIICAQTSKKIAIRGMCKCDLRVWKIVGDSPNRSDGQYYVDPVMYPRALEAARLAGVKVVNLSITGREFDRTEEMLITRLLDAGVTIVAAMGNHFLDGNPIEYPAAIKGVVAVGATDEMNRRAAFSSSGRHIALCAPGANIVSTLPMKPSVCRDAKQTKWGPLDGTSMAAPQVTAAAALLLAADPARTAKDVLRRLQTTATRLSEMRGSKKTFQHGVGLLNIGAALK